MILGVDVGGTKTLLGKFSNDGQLIKSVKFPTNKDYQKFLDELLASANSLSDVGFTSAAIAIPGNIDRDNGIGTKFANLPWVNVPIKKDLQEKLGCPVAVENDAKAGGLSEAINVKNDFKNVLYIAIGTGIGISIIKNGVIVPTYGDRGGNAIEIMKDGRPDSWEHLISGSAIKRRFGMRASDITDEKIWDEISHDLSLGLNELIKEVGPDCVVIGGGAGKRFDKFGDKLIAELSSQLPGTPLPAILPAKRAEEAVIYGCYELAKQ